MHRGVAVLMVGPLLTQFLTKYPDIKVEIFADETNSDIVVGRFDAGIRRGDRIAKDMIAVRLLEGQHIAIVASPAYLARHQPLRRPRTSLVTIAFGCASGIGTVRFSNGTSKRMAASLMWPSTARSYSMIGF
jgi:DNA-binding transcriptional LysR family regulator